MQLQDSQQQVAQSIVRDVQAALPQAQNEPGLASAVNAALRREARASEVTLAIGRVVATAAHLLFSLVAHFRPDHLGLAAYPFSNVVIAAVWCAAAVALLLIIRRGFYHSALRRILPFADVLALSVALGLINWSLQGTAELPTGLVMVAVIACALVAFSGSLRLSRSAAQYSTMAGTLGALAVAVLADLPVMELLFVITAVYATGVLSSRLTRMIRKVITNEIAQAQLARMYHEANQAAVAGKEVLQIVSHDLRNPIHTIGMAADLMLDSPERRRQYDRTISIIKRSTVRMNRLVQDLLDVTKSEKGTLSMDAAVTEIDVLLADAADELEPLARDNGLGFTVTSEAELPDIMADRARLLQVFSNLVGNAVKFTPRGGHVTISAAAAGDKVKFAVIDTGPGIAAEQLSRVFNRFWQASPTDKRGLGLGLTIAKSIVDAHGGEIGVQSKVGEGTSFWFTVPTAAANLAKPPLTH
jgi:signal transduction histidine kinase